LCEGKKISEENEKLNFEKATLGKEVLAIQKKKILNPSRLR
jgi:hypothetical protein